MEEEISRMKTFLKEFNDNQIQSPTSDEMALARVCNYAVDSEDVTGQVIDWVLNYLNNWSCPCPYSLALSIAKKAAQQVSASFSDPSQSETENVDKSSNSTTIYAETIGKLPAICNSLLNQTDLEPSCSSKYMTSVFAIKNKRRKMEDRHVIHHDLNAVLDLKDVPFQSYYAVFDGHSGIDAACYASAQLHINIAKHPDFLSDIQKAIIEGYQITDENFLNKCNKWNIKSGCTAVSALIRDNTVYLSWLGDSQAVLVKEGVPLTITNPHKPDRKDEKQRIESLGGHVSHMGTWRVNGLLAVTRAIGDPDQKKYISSEPELSIVNLDGTEDFLILACDGLWDGMSPEDVIGVLYRYFADCSPDEPLGDTVAIKLVHQSKLQGSEDNITVIVVFLREIKDIKEYSAKFMSSSYCVQGHDFMSMNGSMKTLDMEHSGDTPFSKPTVLELNAASSKKLKNAANVMSSAGFGSASYSYQYVENTSEGAFQNLDSSEMDTAQGVFCSQNVAASCFAPEATALSELPTPPIDDMLASQQFESFYATDLYKELSNSLHSSQTVDVNSSVDANPVSDKTFQSPTMDSFSEPLKSIVTEHSNMSLIDTETMTSANPDAKISPVEAVGIASTVVSTAIETAVKCLSSETEDSVPAQSPKKLNPYAKPFVMKSFFNPEESESKTCSFVSSEISDASLTSEHSTKLKDHCAIDDTVTELTTENVTNQPSLCGVDLKQFTGDIINSCVAGDTAVDFTSQQVSQSTVDISASEHSGIESKPETKQDHFSVTESNLLEHLINQTEENIIGNSLQTDVYDISVPNEDLSNVIQTNVLNPDTTVENSTCVESEISFKDNLLEISKHEAVCEENKLNISDLLTEKFENMNLISNLTEENVTVHDVNALPISDVSKDLSPVSSESPVSHTNMLLEQKLVMDVTMQSSNSKKSDLSEQNQNFHSVHVSMELAPENTTVISENESKHEINEKYIVDTVMRDHHCETISLIESLTNEPQSFIDTQLDITAVEIQSKSPTHGPESGCNTPAGSTELNLPTENQNYNLGVVGLTSENTESKYVAIEKNIVDTVEKNITETSQLIKSITSEPISLIDIKNELIPAESEVPSDPSIEDSHVETVAVDLKSLPVGIPEAEGVTEDIDSDSEKDGGWSYMKGNTVSGSKSKPNDKASKTLKSNEIKSSATSKGRRDVPKPNLDIKSKVKNAAVDKTKSTSVDKTKSISVDKTKTVMSDKSKTIASVDKTKTVAVDKLKNVSSVDKTKALASVDKSKKAVVEKKPDIKTKYMKSSTLSATTKVTIDKTSRVAGVSSIKKETTEATKTASTVTKSTRPTTLVRASVPVNKHVSATVAAAGKVATRPKVSTAIIENKPATKVTTSTLSKGQCAAQTKFSTASTRSASTIPCKTSTITKSSVQKLAVSESKPRQPTSTTLNTLRKPLSTTVKKSEVKEVKDSVNKQILAKKNVTAGKVDSSSTLTSRRIASASSKSTVTRVTSSTTKSEVSKKDVPKAVGLKSAPKSIGSKLSRDNTKGKEKRVESVQFKTEETNNSLNIESGQKNIAEIVQVTEEKFILETSDKEITKEKCEISSEEKEIKGSLTNLVSPIDDKTPTAECAPESL